MPHCPICQSKLGEQTFPYATYWEGQRFEYLRCTGCATTVVDPLPTDIQLAAMYRQDEYHSKHYPEEEVSESELANVIDWLPRGQLLDYGCGNGGFLRLARSLGYETIGIELDSKVRAQAASNSGSEVLSFEEVRSSRRRFHVIHLGDVLEHLPRPAQTMRELRALLAPGGCFLIEGPLENQPSLVLYASRLFGALKSIAKRRTDADLPPFHLFRVNAVDQTRFFEEQLRYDVTYFRIDETGWPYWIKANRSSRPKSLTDAVRRLIGLAGVVSARTLRPFGVSLGNRFVAIVSPTD